MVVSTARIIGRDEVLSRAAESLIEGGLIVLVGQPGIGKTTLWNSLLDAAHFASVVRIACLEAEAELGLAALASLFEQVPDGVVEQLPPAQRSAVEHVLCREADGASTAMPGRLLGLATLATLRRMSSPGPLVFGVDDWQWCDPGSMAAFGFAIQRLRDANLSVIATCRAGNEAAVPPGAVRIPVPPMSDASIRELVLLRGPGVHSAVADRIVSLSAGSPFFAVELASSATPGEEHVTLPPSLREALRRRCSGLAASSTTALLDVAVRGAPSLSEVRLTTLETAINRGLVTVRDGHVRFTHPLLAEVLLGSVPHADVVAAHARAASATVDPVRIARHRAAAEPPTEELASSLDRASEMSGRRGDREGARVLARLALQMTPDRRRPLHRVLRLAQLERALGNMQVAGELGRELHRGADSPDTRARAALFICQSHGHQDELVSAALTAAAEPGVSGPVRERLYVIAALVLFSSGAGANAARMLSDVLSGENDAVANLPGAFGVMSALSRLAGVPVDAHGLDRAVAFERTWNAGADAWRSHHGARAAAGMVAMLDDRHDRARALLTEADEDAAAHGEFNFAGMYLGLLALRTGGLRLADQLLMDCAPYGSTDATLLARRALTNAWLGRIDEASELLQAARQSRMWEPVDRARLEIDFAHGMLHLLAGKPRRAWPHFLRATQLQESMSYREPSMPPLLVSAIEAACSCRHVATAETFAARLDRDTEATGSAYGRAASLAAHGFIAAAREDDRNGYACLSGAVDAFSTLHLPLEVARVRVALGELLDRTGRLRDARRQFELAHTTFSDCGALRLAADLDTRLGRGPSGRRDRIRHLTQAEVDVARLAATGLRNNDVARSLNVSVKTVEAHLSHAYRKLEIKNRTELAQLLAVTDLD